MPDPQPIDLDAIKARAGAATPGPWQGGEEEVADSQSWLLADMFGENRESDAEFIAHAREDVPALVAEVERLRAELKKFRRGGVQLGYGFNHLSLTMRCAWIAEQEKPGTGMRWITNNLAEANAIPGQSMDYERADDWDGTETAQEYHDRFHRDLYEEREANIARIEAEQ